MTQYRITFDDTAGHSCEGCGFEAKDDQEAPVRGRAFVPAQTSGYEIWREDGTQRSPLVFAEWTLTAPPK
jgi:hypothetical protein